MNACLAQPSDPRKTHYLTTPILLNSRLLMSAPEHIAVLGGGITGLSSAFHLSRRFPNSRITLVEKEEKVGGWIRSERATVRTPTTSVSVLLEAGPRTLRPVDKALLELASCLLPSCFLDPDNADLDTPPGSQLTTHYYSKIVPGCQSAVLICTRAQRRTWPIALALRLVVTPFTLVSIETFVEGLIACCYSRALRKG